MTTEEKRPQKPTKAWLEAQVNTATIAMQRNDAMRQFCQAMIDKKIYVEDEPTKEGETNGN